MDNSDRLNSLTVVLPLAVAGFVIAAGCWTIFAVAGVYLRQSLMLGSLEFGLLLAMPMASGALLAVPAGVAAQKAGARRVMIACLLGLAACMGLLLLVDSWTGYLLVSAGLGLAGGFYSAGLQFVIGHCPPRHLGLVLGLFGAGVMGAGFNYFLVPMVIQAFSWAGVPLAYLLVLLLVAALLVLLTEDSDACGEPTQDKGFREGSGWIDHLRIWRQFLYFGAVAGGFFSLILWLPESISTRFLLATETGTPLALWFVVPGALAQVAGGWFSDRYGAERVVTGSLMACLAALFVLSYPPMTLAIRGTGDVIKVELALPLVLEGLLIVCLGLALGCAMGGLQRLVIASNPAAPAITAGMLLVSAFLMAFLLPLLFSALIHWYGVASTMFMTLFLLLVACLYGFARDIRQMERKALFYTSV